MSDTPVDPLTSGLPGLEAADPKVLLSRVRALVAPDSAAFASTQALARLLLWLTEQVASHAAALDGLDSDGPGAAFLACQAIVEALHSPTPSYAGFRAAYEQACAAVGATPRKPPAPFRNMDGAFL